jgi:hypothetical protein
MTSPNTNPEISRNEPNISPQLKAAEQKKLKEEIEKELRNVFGAEERVRIFAKWMDDRLMDPVIGAIAPELGDAGTTGLSGIYLNFEAYNAHLGLPAHLKIIGLQAADLFVGAIPIAGDFADFLFKANKWSVKFFEQKTAELIEKAREAGVSEAKIAQIHKKASELPQLVDQTARVAHQKYQKKKEDEANAAAAA